MLRAVEPDDEPFLWEMLAHASHTPVDQARADPMLRRYVAGWGRPGDLGTVATADDGTTPVGAAWIRTFTAEEPGYAFVDDEVPELAIACVPDVRGRGVGHGLVAAVLDQAAAAGSEAVSLSVRRTNPAAQLVYRDLGFVEPAVPPDDAYGDGSIVLVAPTDPSRRPAPVEVTALDRASDAGAWVLDGAWGETVVSRGRAWRPADLPAFVATVAGEPKGLATWRVEGDEAELVTIEALVPDQGVGTALLRAARTAAAAAGCRRLWLVTTNDNTSALRFYQRRGWVLAAVHVGGIEASRRIKPSIPARGNDGIPIRDELELECALPPFGDVVPDDWVPDE